MRFRQAHVSSNAIDVNDLTCRITTKTSVDTLASSIQSTGLLHPPFLIQKGSSYTIVSGFRRVSALNSIGVPDFEACILERPDLNLDAIIIAITDNALQRPLNIVEKARSVELLSMYITDEDELIHTASKIGIPCDKELLGKLLKISEMPERLQDGLVQGYIAMPVAPILHGFELQTMNRFIDIFHTLQLSLNKQRQFISFVTEISHRDSMSPYTVLNDSRITEILKDDNLDRNQQIRCILDELQCIRFPELSKVSERFHKNLKEIHLGKGIQLIPPANFESAQYVFQLTFKNKKELEIIQQHLDRISKERKFSDLINR